MMRAMKEINVARDDRHAIEKRSPLARPLAGIVRFSGNVNSSQLGEAGGTCIIALISKFYIAIMRVLVLCG